VGHEILVTLTRGNLDESHHYGAYCVVKDGQVLRSRGDIDTPFFMRSAAKPIQAIAVVESEAPDRFGYTDEELAMVVGSHSGSREHARNARSMLEKAGEAPALLRCGGHDPLSRAVQEEYIRQDFKPGRLEDNCSGKHAGMIGAAKAMGKDPASYASPDHPLQQRNLENVALLTGMDERAIGIGVDGCAVPTFAVPVRAMALAAEHFANPDDLPGGKAAAARRLMDVAQKHPEMIAGPGRFDTQLMRIGGGKILPKAGAEGVEIIGVAGERIGIAMKILDGGRRAVHAVVAALLVDLGIVNAPTVTGLYPQQVLSREGDVVGAYKVRL